MRLQNENFLPVVNGRLSKCLLWWYEWECDAGLQMGL
jgi:hypothetical protein